MRFVRLLSVFALLAVGSACMHKSSEGNPSPVTLVVSPAHVQRLIAGERPLALVTTEEQSGAAVDLTAEISLAGAQVAVRPAHLAPGEVAEVWVTLPETSTDTPFTVTVDGARGTTKQPATIAATAVPGVDDLADTAEQIAAVFLHELAGKVDGLPAEVSGLTNGTPVAGLLVVSHYAWFTSQYEIGLSWHIMVAPDDWSELYLRPRGSLQPTKAFKLDSWSTALNGGEYSVTEIAAPAEVTR